MPHYTCCAEYQGIYIFKNNFKHYVRLNTFWLQLCRFGYTLLLIYKSLFITIKYNGKNTISSSIVKDSIMETLVLQCFQLRTDILKIRGHRVSSFWDLRP